MCDQQIVERLAKDNKFYYEDYLNLHEYVFVEDVCDLIDKYFIGHLEFLDILEYIKNTEGVHLYQFCPEEWTDNREISLLKELEPLLWEKYCNLCEYYRNQNGYNCFPKKLTNII
jgi:hypothetical protein